MNIMAGTLTIDTLKASSGVLATQNGMTGVCKAWVTFTGTTGAIYGGAGVGSFNVGSITKNGTGDYTVNFTTAMTSANYSPFVYATATGGGSVRQGTVISISTSAFRYQSVDSAGALSDWPNQNVAIFSV
jgi:hypothetical protein